MEAREDGEEGKRGFPKGFCIGKRSCDFRGDKEKPLGIRILIRKRRWKILEMNEGKKGKWRF